jgi:small neutral amino acid transporter SnatA (MarC family)
VTALSILIVIGITYILLEYIDRIYRLIGRRGSIIVTRVFAVLIAAIAVQFIVDGAGRSLARKDLLIYLATGFETIDRTQQ